MEDVEKKRIVWHSRRGMLELDLLLVPFARDCYNGLAPGHQLLYRQLLEQEDQDLFAWLLNRASPPRQGFGELVSLILEHASGTN
ncbi:MAG: succinate dehydrogenase assembly factor 2 [Pseudohongiellaceae bacterium]